MTELTWFGISAVQISTHNKKVIIDPYLTDNPLGPYDLEDIETDLVMVTHGARDHFGDAVELTIKTGAMLIGPVDCITRAIDQGVDEKKTKKCVPGGERTIFGITIKPLYAQHLSTTRYDGKFIQGVPLSYMITLDNGLKIYHAGDTALHPQFKMFGEIYKPDIGFMPIGMFPGASTEMNPMEAALASVWMNLSTAIPIHFDPDTQADYVDWFEREVKSKDKRIDVPHLEAGVAYEMKRVSEKNNFVTFTKI
jgi:L-ascorbate metabolism protein UlaG (beta-lactamase superfamily)